MGYFNLKFRVDSLLGHVENVEIDSSFSIIETLKLLKQYAIYISFNNVAIEFRFTSVIRHWLIPLTRRHLFSRVDGGERSELFPKYNFSREK